jgi:hypothetical protein
VIPSWVANVFGPRKPGERLAHTIQTPTGERRFAPNSFELTVKRVCRPCNHGWMEQAIEAPNQSILPQMFLGVGRPLSPSEQQHVATWAIKTHLMVQFHEVASRAVAPEHLRWLYEHRTPPPKSRVWLAAFAGELPHLVWCRTHTFELLAAGGPQIAARNTVRVETMTLCIGQLVLQSYKWSGPVDKFAFGIPDSLRPFLVPLWPPEVNGVVMWPPPWTLEDARALEEFSEQWISTGPHPGTQNPERPHDPATPA